MIQPKTPKPRKCAARKCRVEFTPRTSLQRVCSPACAVELVAQRKKTDEAKAQAAQRKDDRARREKLKTRRDWMREAQTAFNAFIRARDRGRACICCGLPLELGAVGGGYDAGHYRSVGSAPHMRFSEDNCHAQRKQCNRWGAGRAVDFRLGLIARIGLARVEALEADQTPRKWTILELKCIRDTYRAKARALIKSSQPTKKEDHDHTEPEAHCAA